MRFLTYSESARWCELHGYATRKREGYVVPPEPDIATDEFARVEFALPKDSGRKVWLARLLYDAADQSSEVMMWLADWAVWPSCQHIPLFTRFREAFGEHRPLIEAPGHVVVPDEVEDGISILTTSLLFFWDCHLLTASGRDVIFVSHNEIGWFGSRDAAVASAVRQQLTDAKLEVR